MAEIMAAEAAGRGRPRRIDGGILENIKKIGVNGPLQIAASAHADVAAPQRMPGTRMRAQQRTEALLPGAAGGCDILRRAAAPARARRGHEFGESVAMAASYAGLDFQIDTVG